MPLTRVKEKYQVTIPAPIRAKAGVTIGDLLEAKVEGRKITLAPKAIVDKHLRASLLASLAEAKRRGTLGPFRNAKAAIRALKQVKA